MSEEISAYAMGELSAHEGKPFITNQMPKINPYLIWLTVGDCKSCQKTTYFVIDKNNGGPWGTGKTSAEAIADAKDLYKHFSEKGNLDEQIARYNDMAKAAIEAEKELYRILSLPPQPYVKERKKLTKKLPKRAIVFQKNEGKCFYCDDQLVIDGDWHIEHKQPKSKGGSNEIENLVPACPSCNLRKKDKTAKQFLETSA